MRSYRIGHQVLCVLAFLPLVFSWGPWQLMLLIPLALVVPYGINELMIAKRESREAMSPAALGSIAHAYREKPRDERNLRRPRGVGGG